MFERAFPALAGGILAAAVLMFPELVPGPWRFIVTTVLAITAMTTAVAFLEGPRAIRWPVAVFLGALIVGWLRLPEHEIVGIRHFSGVGLGIAAMTLVTRTCRTTEHLVVGACLIATAGAAVLTAGTASSRLDTSKFIDTARHLPTRLFPWLPEWRLPLPGLEPGGVVNPNALGGTALMLAPLCGGAFAALFAIKHRRRVFLMIAAAVAVAVTFSVFAMSLSRTAWLAGALTLAVAGLRWRRGRWWAACALLLAAIGFSIGLEQTLSMRRGPLHEVMRLTTGSFEERRQIWLDGLDSLSTAPLFGVGINQFHEVSRTLGAHGSGRVPHAHQVFLQVALDAGLVGLAGYLWLGIALLWLASAVAAEGGAAGRIAAGGGISLLAVHLFGLGDAIALGAKVGLFQWLSAGLILAAGQLQARNSDLARTTAPAYLP